MSSVAGVRFMYRCMHCFQALYSTTDEVGEMTTCSHCGQEVLIPEATPERIERAKDAPEEPAPAFEPEPLPPADDNWMNADIERELKEQLYVAPGEMLTLSTMAASRVKRFLGCILDGLVVVGALIIGFLLLLGLSAVGVINLKALQNARGGVAMIGAINAMCVMYFPVFAAVMFQWWLIATRGQSIGKFLLCMRIVTEGGRNPGFLQAVVLRNWVRALLNMLPFFALIDALFIFGDSRRCLHDLIANTHVVDV